MERRQPKWAWFAWVTLAAAWVLGSAGAADAKTWAKWAPDPLASDSSFAALSSRSADSLGVGELTWIEVQKDWRVQRDAEAHLAYGGISEAGRRHHVRPQDGRFAALASRPYGSLTDTERAWLVAENSAQRVANEESRHESTGGGYLALGLLVGVLGGIWLAARAVSDAFGHL